MTVDMFLAMLDMLSVVTAAAIPNPALTGTGVPAGM